MGHPQPAFDLLRSLPTDPDLNENLFRDWWEYDAIDAGKHDDIADHPEVWNRMELPDGLASLSLDDGVMVRVLDGGLPLNAIAIGLGLEDLEYEPESFPALVYYPQVDDAVVIAFHEAIVLSIGETVESSENVISHFEDRLGDLGLGDDVRFESTHTGQVSDFI